MVRPVRAARRPTIRSKSVDTDPCGSSRVCVTLAAVVSAHTSSEGLASRIVQVNRPIEDRHDAAANLDLDQLVTVKLEANPHIAGSAHFYSLMADDVHSPTHWNESLVNKV